MLSATEHSGCLFPFPPPLTLIISQNVEEAICLHLSSSSRVEKIRQKSRDACWQVQYFWPRLLKNGGKHDEKKKKNPRNEVGSWGARQSWGLGGKSMVLQLKSVSESRDESRTAVLPTPEQPLPTPEQRHREPLPPETHPFSPTKVAIQW